MNSRIEDHKKIMKISSMHCSFFFEQQNLKP
jgi:hypothetical protein